MSGSLRFESTSASSEELGYTNSYSNGQRGSYLGASLGRSGSFRESNESRVFGSGSLPRSHVSTMTAELPPLSQCLALEPITIGDQKFSRSGEVKRVLGFSYSSLADDSSLGAAHARGPTPVASEDLKRFKASVEDTSMKARGRTKKLDESLQKLNKYYEAINSPKYQRSESLTNEKSVGPSLPKNGSQMQRNPPEDRSKNVNSHKRVRTAVADIQSEGRSNAPLRPNLSAGKEKDVSKEGTVGFDVAEDKTRKLPAAGEVWDKRMKRKRTIGNAFSRPSDGDGDVKRPMIQKLPNESGLQPCDGQVGRSGLLNSTSSMNRLDSPFSVSANARGMPKNEPEKLSLPRDATLGLNKERVVAKGNNNKVNIREDSHTMSSNPVIKGKGSRAPRTAPVTGASPSPNISRLSVAIEGWEQPSGVNKLQSMNGGNNRKRPILSVSSSPPMAQWVGQRPQKIQRNRRANLISPVSNHDDLQTSSEGGSQDIGGRTHSSTTNGPPHMKGVSNGLKQTKVKHETVSSPSLLSESEESGAGEDKVEEKGKIGTGLEGNLFGGNQHVGSPSQPTKKNKLHLNDESGDGIRRQGRTGRGLQSSRSNISLIGDTFEGATKPARNVRPGYDKSGSKSGRPPIKKSSDRTKFTRLGQIPIGGSPDCTGDSDDDREELLAVAEFVRDSSSVTCTNSFWKQMEIVFGSVRSGNEDTPPYLEQELKSSEKLHENLLQMLNCADSVLGNDQYDEGSRLQVLNCKELERNLSNDVTKRPTRAADMVDQFQDRNDGNVLKEKFKDFPPLYQRVLSALIVEDESEELDEAYAESEGTPQFARDRFPSCIDMDFEFDTVLGLQMRERFAPENISCNGNYVLDKGAGIQSPMCNGELYHSDHDSMYRVKEDTPGRINTIGMSPFDCPYDQMHLEERLLLELHSIGLYPETVPDLSEGEEESINDELFEMKKGLCDLADKKRLHLRKACEAIQEEKKQEGRHLEQFAMDRLTEVAYRKLLATRGSSSSKSGTKVSKQVALTFVKRTLARCHSFEASGKSCFNDPPIRDILTARPSMNIADPSQSARSGFVPNRGEGHGSVDALSDQAFSRNGPLFNRGKKKEVLLDDVGATTPLKAFASPGNQVLGGAKGKRSERDARNNSAKSGRASLGSSKGERQPKSKPKQQKSSQHPTGSGFPGRSVHNIGNGGAPEQASNKKRNTGPSFPTGPHDLKKDSKGQMDFSNLPLDDLHSMEGLGVGPALGENQDLDTWLNFDEDGIQDHDAFDPLDLDGLEIPMDDLSDLNMML